MMSRRKRRDWDAISWNVTCVQVRPLCFSSPSQIKYSCHSSPTKTWALPSPRTWSPSFFFYSIIIPRSLIVCERNKQKWSFRSKNGVGSLLVASSIKGGQHERRCNYSAAVGETMYSTWSSDVVVLCLGIWSICRGTVLKNKRRGHLPPPPSIHWSRQNKSSVIGQWGSK